MEWAARCSVGWSWSWGGGVGWAGGGPGHGVCPPPASLRGANSARAEGSFTGDPGLSPGLTGPEDSRHHTVNRSGPPEQLALRLPRFPSRREKKFSLRKQVAAPRLQTSAARRALLRSRHCCTQSVRWLRYQLTSLPSRSPASFAGSSICGDERDFQQSRYMEHTLRTVGTRLLGLC